MKKCPRCDYSIPHDHVGRCLNCNWDFIDFKNLSLEEIEEFNLEQIKLLFDKYTYIYEEFSHHLMLVGVVDEWESVWGDEWREERSFGYINSHCYEAIPLKYHNASPFDKEGIACIQFNYCNKAEDSFKYAYINTKEELVIPHKYYYAEPFGENDYAIVSLLDDFEKEQYGVINRKGEFLVPCEYENIFEVYRPDIFSKRLALVKNDRIYSCNPVTGKVYKQYR